jgi:hypothetical protein
MPVGVLVAAQELGGVVVETANPLQRLEFDVVVAWHPLAGLPEPDGFHLDPGRLCVLLTRHRHACVVVGRADDDEMLDDKPPPPTPAYLAGDPDPVLDGWEVHRQVFAALEPVRLASYFYSRRNLTPRCLARHVLACDFWATLFRRTW